MSSSARLYERLDQIPDDPKDPESLEDVVVCAFGAFERYYVCWKTRGGAHRQDGYDLPSDLKEFLFAKADERDYASLQVVFGRGNEFFASDNNGKLEYKEPEPEKKEPTPEELVDKRALRRTRTISFMRPRSDESNRQNFLDLESQSPVSSRRSSLINGRPPSLSLSFRSNSDASLHSLNSQPDSRAPSASHTRLSSDSSTSSQLSSRPSSNQTTSPSRPSSYSESKNDDATNEFVEYDTPIALPPIPQSTQSTKRLRPLSMSFKGGLIPRIPEGKQVPQQTPSPPPPLPPVPSVPTSSNSTPARLWSAARLWTSKSESTSSSSSPGVQPLQLIQRTVQQPPATRSISPPFQLPDQTESPMAAEEPRPVLAPAKANVAAQMSPVTTNFVPLSLHLSKSSVTTTPVSPVAAPIIETPPAPTLSIQIISTTVQTSPISPTSAHVAVTAALIPPPVLSMHFSAISTTPIEAPPLPGPVANSTPVPVSLSTCSTSTQTSPPTSPLRTALGPLRINTGVAAPSFPQHSYSFSTSSSVQDIETPQDYPQDGEYYEQAYYEPPPVFMGRMMDYYSKPGYQLGSSLFGGYHAREPVIEGEGEGGLTEWERANGRGY